MRVTEFVAEQRDAFGLIYGLPKHLPYYCRVIMAVLKSNKIWDACEIINIDIRSYRLKFRSAFRVNVAFLGYNDKRGISPPPISH